VLKGGSPSARSRTCTARNRSSSTRDRTIMRNVTGSIAGFLQPFRCRSVPRAERNPEPLQLAPFLLTRALGSWRAVVPTVNDWLSLK
jgi:hypothetical protein